MSSANSRQVAGTHYRNPFQHWDLAAELELGYFEGQITKYVTRHRSKKGREDAEKALHFCQKLMELHVTIGFRAKHKFITSARLAEYAEANRLNDLETRIIRGVLNWTDLADLSAVGLMLAGLVGTYDGEAGPGYVHQDRGAT